MRKQTLFIGFGLLVFSLSANTLAQELNHQPGTHVEASITETFRKYVLNNSAKIIEAKALVKKSKEELEVTKRDFNLTPKPSFGDHFTWLGEGTKGKADTYKAAQNKVYEKEKNLKAAEEKLKVEKEVVELIVTEFLKQNDTKFIQDAQIERHLRPAAKAGKKALEKYKKAIDEIATAQLHHTFNGISDALGGDGDDFSRGRDIYASSKTQSALESAKAAAEAISDFRDELAELSKVKLPNSPKINDSLSSYFSQGGAFYGLYSGKSAGSGEVLVRAFGRLGQVLDLSSAETELKKLKDPVEKAEAQISAEYGPVDAAMKASIAAKKAEALAILEE